MGLLRSEEMAYGMLVLPPQDARKYVELLGKNANCKVQFEDMNAKEMKRPYRKYIQRIDEMERHLRFIWDEISKNPNMIITKNHIDEFMTYSDYKLDDVEAELKSLYEQFVKFKENDVQLQTELNQAIEERKVVETAQKWLGSVSATGGNEPLLQSERRLNNVAGVVSKQDEQRFSRALWRASRGNTYTDFDPITEPMKDPKTGNDTQKSVFVVYFQANPDAAGHSALMSKVQKVCSAFGVNNYNWPTSAAEAGARVEQLKGMESDKRQALRAYKSFMGAESAALVAPVRHIVPEQFGATSASTRAVEGNSRIEDIRLFCIKEKSVYATLNLCSDDMTLRVNCWYPKKEEENIKEILNKENASSRMQAALVPYPKNKNRHHPTYIESNDFTEPWQDVIDTYGIPNYQTANPAVVTTVTFPFIFGMMYGDIGHGTLLFLVGVYLVMNAESFRYTVPQAYAARFLVLQLGLFAVFAGFMYNDLFGIVSLELFESRWDRDASDWKPDFNKLNVEGGGRGPYPFGLDPGWHGSTAELLFTNSLKMKLSVLMGVIQMTLGLFLRVANTIHDRNMVDFIFEVIPMFVFMVCFFGFMDYMILFKWTNKVPQVNDPGAWGGDAHANGPPSIINSLICMAMFTDDTTPLWDGSGDFAHQLMTYAVIAVPFMLFPKPFILLAQHNSKKKDGAEQLHDDEEMGGGGGHGHGHGEFEFGEVFIHQIIETIEYVLGTVSHTASYLRIWALSLAHQQLSLVFYSKSLQMAFGFSWPNNAFAIYFLFAAWFVVTIGVLLGMDVLECFLHTLRLHWVEFQSKFYKSDSGVKFAPYSIRALILAEE